jgi:heme exporter protein A
MSVIANAEIKSRPVARVVSVVQALDLTKWIDGRPILREINLDIPSGRFVVVLGANGAGKSTLLKVLATLTRPSSGDLRLFGQAVGADAARLRARIGIISHQSMLYRELSARDNLVFFGRLYGVRRPEERAMDLLAMVGLADRADDPVKTFSRGMTQRAAIARALVHEPDLLLADEPFAGLDAPAVKALEELLGRLHGQGKTIILTHHDVDHSLRMAEQAVVLRAGQVVVDRWARQLDAATAIREMTAA